MIISYSATGNSRHCAEVLSALLGDELVDSFHYIRDGIAFERLSGRPWVFVCPTHGWRIPRIFENFLRSGYFEGEQQAYFVLTCGTDMGGAGKYLKALCAEKGLTYMGALPLVMPENYIALFAVPDEAESLRIIEEAKPTLRQAAERIKNSLPFDEKKPTLLDGLKSGIVHRGFCTLFIKDKPFWVTEKCVGCGKCADVCPTGNIVLREGKPQWQGSCTHCMACICRCPTEAIEYGRRTKKRRRYQCPQK